MNRLICKIVLFVCATTLAGCSSAVSSYISGQQSFEYDPIISRETLAQQGFSKSEFCSAVTGSCLSYLAATPLSDKHKLRYQVSIRANGKEELNQLEIQRNDINCYSGLVVLIHGFRASKEFMVNSALYFRFLGFDVVIPDLLGHGESSPGIRFGIEDSRVISELLDELETNEKALIIVGNSLGAVAATELPSLRNDIDGLVLQAPMVVFDDAVANYMDAYSPILSSVIPASSVKSGAVEALGNAGLEIEQTDITAALANGSTPTLILVSNSDSVAPPDSFKQLSSDLITVVEFSGRSHPSMSVITQQDNEVIRGWLLTTAGKSSQRTCS
ncbi:MAG: alpha/beta fold hydrolase [Halioglobus sp.]